MIRQHDLLLAGLLVLCAAAWLGGTLLARRRAGQAGALTADEAAGRWTVGLLLLAVWGSVMLSLWS